MDFQFSFSQRHTNNIIGQQTLKLLDSQNLKIAFLILLEYLTIIDTFDVDASLL